MLLLRTLLLPEEDLCIVCLGEEAAGPVAASSPLVKESGRLRALNAPRGDASAPNEEFLDPIPGRVAGESNATCDAADATEP